MVNTVRAKDVWEVFEAISKASSRKEKIKILRANNKPAVRDVLRGTFDPVIVWALPEGVPPYTPQPEGPPSPRSLLKEHMTFRYFIKGFPSAENLDQLKRERLFIDLLECVQPKDAAILVTMINKQKPEYDGLTIKLVKEALPDLIPD